MRTSGSPAAGTVVIGFMLAFLAGVGLMQALKPGAAGAHGETVKADPAAGGVAPSAPNPDAVRVDLHVMSQCPYGVQAENGFKDVAAKFGKDLDLHVEYIGQTTPGGDLSSMHGPNEVKGDLVQVCAQKYAPDKSFDFVLCQDENPKEVGTNGEGCAKKLGMPVKDILACAAGAEGKALLTASFKRSQDKGAQGSPTIFVGGNKYDGGRKPTDLMKAICSAASGKKPAACADIPESPLVNVTVLGDTRCGSDCDTSGFQGGIRQHIGNPAITVLDYTSPEGKKLYAAIKPVSLPAIVFDRTLDADKDAAAELGSAAKSVGDYKVIAAGGWNPACADDGGCKLAECQSTMQCRAEIPKKLDVFVMSHCPYGVKGLDAMKEVADTFKQAGTSIDFTIHYIGDDEPGKGLTSMHGPTEVEEDRREACVIKHYPKNLKFMEYIWCRDKAINDSNWQSCTGGSTGFDTDAIKQCSEGDEGKGLVAASFAESKGLGIGASPTWLANNKYKFSGVDAETIKENICAHNKIAGCDKQLSGQGAAPQQGGGGGAQQPGCGN